MKNRFNSRIYSFLLSKNDDFSNSANRSFKSALPGYSPSIKISGLIISGRYLAILNGACLGNAMFHEVGADTGAGNVRPRNSVWWCSAPRSGAQLRRAKHTLITTLHHHHCQDASWS